MSLGVLVVAIAGIVIGCVLLVKTLKRRLNKKDIGGDYRRIEAAEVLLDDWVRDEEALLSSSDDDSDNDTRRR